MLDIVIIFSKVLEEIDTVAAFLRRRGLVFLACRARDRPFQVAALAAALCQSLCDLRIVEVDSG
jgi:hypothetical protein